MISSAKPKKSLGQNFLTSVGAVNKIVDTAVEATVKLEVGPPTGGTTSNFTVLEIGPGKGVLTKALLKKFEKVLAVEKDDNLFVELGEKFTKEIETGQLTLIHGDILELTPGKLGLISKNYATVANLPYYITGQFLRSWLETEFPPKFMVLMLQKEVAERITARDGKESLLSISVKAYGEPKYIETIKRGSFYPIPNVDSAILLINNISKEFFKRRGSEVSFIANPPLFPRAGKETSEPLLSPLVSAKESSPAITFSVHGKRGEFTTKVFSGQDLVVNQEKAFFNILRAGFAHKRKFLIKNLEDMSRLIGDPPERRQKLRKAFEVCEISPKARAEDIKPEDWRCLAEKI